MSASADDDAAGRHTVPVIDRMMDVLAEIERSSDGLTIRALTEALALPRTSVYRILNTLQSHEMVRRDERGGYHLGRRLLALAGRVAARASEIDVGAICQPYLDRLATDLGEGIKLSVLDDDGVLVLAAAQGRREYALTVSAGQRVAAHSGAAGKLLLAHLPPPELDRRLARPLVAFTSKTITDPRRLRAELARIRRLGWAQDKGETAPSIQAFAAPVFALDGSLLAALSVPFLAGTEARRMEEIRLAVIDAARAIGAVMPAYGKSGGRVDALDMEPVRREGRGMSGLTLRQVEVIRAVMLTGSIAGAADYLNVSGPGISRLVKHAEESLRVRLFERKGGVFLPAPEARAVFDQINEVYGKIEGLETAIANLNSGQSGALAFGSVPSVAQFIVARACFAIRRRYPDLYIDLNVLKIEETVDYLLLERGELVAMSYVFAHPSLDFVELGQGQLVAVVPDDHPLARRQRLSVRELAREPMIGVSATDPYGAIIAGAFARADAEYRLSIRARFAQTVVSLVRHGLGVAVIDEFSVAGVYMPGLTRIPLEEETEIRIFGVTKKARSQSAYAAFAMTRLREELRAAVRSRPWETPARP